MSGSLSSFEDWLKQNSTTNSLSLTSSFPQINFNQSIVQQPQIEDDVNGNSLSQYRIDLDKYFPKPNLLNEVNFKIPELTEVSLPKFGAESKIPNKGLKDLVGEAITENADKINTIQKSIAGAIGNRPEMNGPNAGLANTLDKAYDTIQNMASKLPGPYGKLVSVAMGTNKVLSNAVGKIGGGTDGMTGLDTVMGSPFMSMTPLGLINGFGGTKSDTITKDEEAFEQVGSSYGGTNDIVNKALTKSGKKYGLFSSGARKKANAEIAEAKNQQNLMSNIADIASDQNTLAGTMSAINTNAAGFQLSGGYQQSAVHAGRNGMKFKNRAKCIVNNYYESVKTFQRGGQLDLCDEVIECEEIDMTEIDVFKKGGSFNIIPEGALHARKHNLDIDNITKKGIPVIAEDKDGSIIQQAEIEREELILRLEVTDKIEKLSKIDGTQKEKDSAAIKAGKLLVQELLYNTQDNTNRII